MVEPPARRLPMLSLWAMLASLVVSACAFAVAMRMPPPVLHGPEVDGKLVWDLAFVAVMPAALLWVICLTRPSLGMHAFATEWGLAASGAAWVLRAPRPGDDDSDDDWRGGGGEDPRPAPPGDPRGGEQIDWAAFERAVDAASPAQREVGGDRRIRVPA